MRKKRRDLPLKGRQVFGKLKMMKKYSRWRLLGGGDVGRWGMIPSLGAREHSAYFLRWEGCCRIRCIEVICKRDQKSKLIRD